MSPGPDLSPQSHAAVIDVGSNSVRLVLYRLEGRAIWATYNEKVLAGLGRDLGSTGKLSRDGVKMALAALKRFRAILDAVGPEQVFAVATAAVRDSSDGAAFIDKIREETGLSVRILSGEEEARYAALGVLAGAPNSDGIAGDLGGASLELTRLEPQGPGEAVTLALGPFSLGYSAGDEARKLRGTIHAEIAKVAATFKAETFHAVGGAWRNLALLHMGISGYPLRVVHDYEISAAEALTAARLISRLSPTSLERTPGVSKKRLENLPYAAVVIEELIEQLGIRRILVSSYGLREGLLYQAMAPGIRAQDPLVAGCTAIGGRFTNDEGFAQALERWVGPLFASQPPLFGQRDAVMIAAACRLSELGTTLHPDHRPFILFEQVLRAPVAGQSHIERAFLAVATFYRHTAKAELPEPATLARILPDAHRKRARALGAAIRLGCDLSGRSAALLAHSKVSTGAGKLKLTTERGWSDLLAGDQTRRRAQALAAALGVRLEITAR